MKPWIWLLHESPAPLLWVRLCRDSFSLSLGSHSRPSWHLPRRLGQTQESSWSLSFLLWGDDCERSTGLWLRWNPVRTLENIRLSKYNSCLGSGWAPHAKMCLRPKQVTTIRPRSCLIFSLRNTTFTILKTKRHFEGTVNQALNEHFWNPRVFPADLTLKVNIQPSPHATLTAAPLTLQNNSCFLRNRITCIFFWDKKWTSLSISSLVFQWFSPTFFTWYWVRKR